MSAVFLLVSLFEGHVHAQTDTRMQRPLSRPSLSAAKDSALHMDEESRFAIQAAGGTVAFLGLLGLAGGLWPWVQNERAVNAGQDALTQGNREAYQNALDAMGQARQADQAWGRTLLGVGALSLGAGVLIMLGASWLYCSDEVD